MHLDHARSASTSEKVNTDYFENSIEFMFCESRRQCTKISKGINAMNTEIKKCLVVLLAIWLPVKCSAEVLLIAFHHTAVYNTAEYWDRSLLSFIFSKKKNTKTNVWITKILGSIETLVVSGLINQRAIFILPEHSSAYLSALVRLKKD